MSLPIHQMNGRFRLLPEYSKLRDYIADWLLVYSDKVLKQKNFDNIPTLNLEGLQLYLVRRGTIIQTQNINEDYEKSLDLQKQFFLGIRQRGKVFETKSKLFFDRPWDWEEFDRLRRDLNVSKKNGTFRLWSMQGDKNLFLFLIYDLSKINEFKQSDKFKLASSPFIDYLKKFPIRIVLSLALGLVVLILFMYPLMTFHLCRYDIILGLILSAILLFTRDGISYLMTDWFNSLQEVEIKQKRNEMNKATLNFLTSFSDTTNDYGRKVAEQFRQNVKWNLLKQNQLDHLKSVAESDLYSNILLVSNIGVWELSDRFKVNSKELIDVFAEGFIQKLLGRSLTEPELSVLGNRAGIMDIWVKEGKRVSFMNNSMASSNDAEFRITSVSQNDIGLFWSGIVSENKEYAAYLVLHNNTLEMLKVFLKQLKAIKKSEYTYIFSDERNRILHQWGANSSEIENRFRMRQLSRLSDESSDWIQVTINHHAFGKKMFHVFTKRSQVLEALNRRQAQFKQILNLASCVAFVLLLLLVLRFRIQIAKVLNGLNKATKSDFDFHLAKFGWDETSQVLTSFNLINDKLHSNQQLSPFVAKEILDLFRDKEGRLQRELADNAVVMFSDIRSFTTLSEQQTPEEVVAMLNQYFEIWAETVSRYGGVIERFIGDAIQVIFFQTKVRNTQQAAIECAIKTREKIMEWNLARQARGEFVVKNGIGLATGDIRFTILGNSVKRHFVSQGEAVIKAEELEAISAYGKSTCIVSDRATMQLLDGQYDFIRWTHEDQLIFELKEE